MQVFLSTGINSNLGVPSYILCPRNQLLNIIIWAIKLHMYIFYKQQIIRVGGKEGTPKTSIQCE